MKTWRKSSYSSDSASCVEVADGPRVGVRDSKDPAGPVLWFPVASWRAFITAAVRGLPDSEPDPRR